MKGVARSSGAITFVNALGTGVGSAAGVSMPVEATVELDATRGSSTVELPLDSDSPLVRATVAAALGAWAPNRSFAAAIRVRSEIPPARGLKSSSAVSGAVARAVAAALRILVTNEEVARLSADVSQSIGLSATGAFDDALATLEPGIHVTDNSARRRIRSDTIDPSWQVVLWIPRQLHLPSPVYREQFHRLREQAAAAERAARRGAALDAMAANTRVVEQAVGYDYGTIREELRSHGALGSGVSGLGPALAIITPPERIGAILRTLPPGEGEVLVTRFTNSLAEPLVEGT